MNIGVQEAGIWFLSLIVAILPFFFKRTLNQYDTSLKNLGLELREYSSSFKGVITDLQKELQQVRLESALFKQSAADISRFADRISALEKSQIIQESQIKAAFAILSGKRGVRDEQPNSNN
jgi:hypothetical protein